MTTNAAFTKTVGKIVEEALRDARIIPVEQPVQAKDYERGRDALNNVAKFWQTQDINLWLEKEAALPLIPDQQKYLLGPGGAECSVAGEFFNTTLGSDQSASDTVIAVASTANMNAAPDILTSDPTDSTQDWTAINSATLSIASGLVITNVGATAGGADYTLSTTVGQTYRVRFSYTLGTSASCTFSVLNGATGEDSVTLSASSTTGELTITAANNTITFRVQNVSTTTGEDSTVFDVNYADEETGSRIGIELSDGTRHWDYVLNVDSATSVDIVTGLSGGGTSGDSVYFYSEKIQRPLRILSARYANSITGSEIPTNKWSRDEYFDQPDKDSSGTVNQWYYSPVLTNGELYIWQVANSINNILRFTYISPALTYTENTDLLDFPSEFFIPLKWAIAADVGPSYGLPDNRQLVIESKAADTLSQALAHDTEYTSMLIQPDFN